MSIPDSFRQTEANAAQTSLEKSPVEIITNGSLGDIAKLVVSSFFTNQNSSQGGVLEVLEKAEKRVELTSGTQGKTPSSKS